jgi:hypothetical protein
MRHVPGEPSFEAEASDQSRWCAGTGRRWTGSFAGGKRIRIHSSDRRRSAISEHHTQSTLRSWRRGNGRRESCDIPPLRQGKQHRPLHADGARLRLRWMPWLWRWMSWLRWRWISWLWRWISRLWLQRLRLRWLRRRLGRFLGRLRLRRLLLIVGRLPFLLIRGAPCGASTSEYFFGRAREATRPILARTTGTFALVRPNSLTTSHPELLSTPVRKDIGATAGLALTLEFGCRK